MDESGDLGLKKSSSEWYIICAVITDDRRALERVVKKVWVNLKSKTRGELHATHESNIVRKRFLKKLCDVKSIQVACAMVNKSWFKKRKLNANENIYLLILESLINDILILSRLDTSKNVEIYIDQNDTKKTSRDKLVSDLTSYLESKYPARFSVTLESSHDNKSLQAVDFIAWALFQKYERSNSEFYELIRDRILFESISR